MVTNLVLLQILFALCCYRCVEPSIFTIEPFSQETVKLLPCQKPTYTVSLYNSTLITVVANLTYCRNFNETLATNGFRISTSIEDFDDAGNSSPVVFSARQSSKDGFVSWNAPLNYSSTLFPDVSHTMCTVKNFTEDALPLFYIDAFTSSQHSINFTIEVEPVQNFALQPDTTYSIDVGHATPQVYYYKIPDDVELVTVEASSKVNHGCTIISIQDNRCPVNDLPDNVRSKGTYQTMINSSFVTLDAGSFTNREFLLVLVTANYSLCYADPTPNPNRTIEVRISHMTPTREYLLAMWLPVIVCLGVYIISIAVVCCCYAPRCEPKWIPFQFVNYMCQAKSKRTCNPCVPIRPCRCVICYGPDSDDSDDDTDETVKDFKKGVWKYVCCEPDHDQVKEAELCVCSADTATSDDRSLSDTATSDERSRLVNNKTQNPTYGANEASANSTAAVITVINGGEEDDVSEKPATTGDAQGNEETNQSQGQNVERNSTTNNVQNPYHVYSWSTVTVGIFYALPALQLVLSEQKILNLSGDQDTCYYNFKCAHPIGPFTSFNNMWSNIGYLMMGFWFIVIVFFRHCQYLIRKSRNEEYVKDHGVPQYFGVYYAMGFGLIIEGFMSSFYHICPSDANFQFDTAFMFITGGVVLVKVYQNRHPNVQANAFIAFFAFAVIIFFTVIGIYNDIDHPIPVKVSFFFLALVVIIYFLAHFYPWKFNYQEYQHILKEFRCDCGYNNCCKRFSEYICGSCKLLAELCVWLCSCHRWMEFISTNRHRIAKHVIIVLINVILGIAICVKYNKVGIATAVLTFFVLNIIVYLVLYCIIKILYGEPWTWLSPVLLALLIAAWAGAYYFYGSVTEWTYTPALSRTLNKPCIVVGFYGDHDVWHFLSAFGMFFAFLFVLVIDDGVVNMEQKVLLERAV